MDFKKILVAVDNSVCAENAAKVAYDMATKFDAEIALLNVIEPTTAPVSPDYAITPVYLEIYDNSEEHSHVLLEEMEKRIGNGAKTTYLSTLDTTAHGITHQAEEWGADLIVLGTHGRTGLAHFLLGNVSEHVARKSACPVLIVPCKD